MNIPGTFVGNDAISSAVADRTWQHASAYQRTQKDYESLTETNSDPGDIF